MKTAKKIINVNWKVPTRYENTSLSKRKIKKHKELKMRARVDEEAGGGEWPIHFNT